LVSPSSPAPKKEEEKDTTAPVIAEVYPVTTPTSDPSPNYTFSSTEAGTITYGGSCSSGTTSATSGNNTITFLTLSDGTYSNCTIIVTDSDGNASNTLAVTTFVVDTTTRTATAIAAGYQHACALMGNASVKCWGYNNRGQLGIDSTTNMGDNSSEMALLTGINLGTGRTATAIAAGYSHTCALLDDASVKCWGQNGRGQLGIDNTTRMGDDTGEMALLTGIDLGTGRTATAIAAGEYHSCALLDNASVKCWGKNDWGQLGIDSTLAMGNSSGEMALLTGINLGTGRTAIAIAAGDYNTCALLDNASVKCWGSNGDGESGIDNATDDDIGDSSGEMALLPVVKLGTGRTATAISIGNDHICAVLDDASVKCWGSNDWGQLGIDNTNSMGDNSSEMALLTGINLGTGRTATAIAAGNSFTCAVLDDASVKCWGRNSSGQLGIGNNTTMGDNSSEMAVLPSINF